MKGSAAGHTADAEHRTADRTQPPEGTPMSHATVTRAVDLLLVVGPVDTLAVPATLTYTAADPYAITAVFEAGDHGAVTWVFARDLLAAGLDRPTGEGDVAVWPSLDAGMHVVCVSLSSPAGHALFEAPRAELAEFLAQTEALVAIGSEGDHVDLDAALADLLAGL